MPVSSPQDDGHVIPLQLAFDTHFLQGNTTTQRHLLRNTVLYFSSLKQMRALSCHCNQQLYKLWFPSWKITVTCYYTTQQSHSNGNASGDARAGTIRLTILSVGMMGDPCHPMLISTEEEKPCTSCCLIASFSSSSTGNLHLFLDRD